MFAGSYFFTLCNCVDVRTKGSPSAEHRGSGNDSVQMRDPSAGVFAELELEWE